MRHPPRHQGIFNPNYHVCPKYHVSLSHRASPTHHASPRPSGGRPRPFAMVATTIRKEWGGCHNHQKRRARGEAAK